jgi:GT2 family glycosyltransferase
MSSVTGDPRPTASVIVPTRGRPQYLQVALASIAPQVNAAAAELLVVDDGPDEASRLAAERHGAHYVAHAAPRGLNAARNTGIDHARSDLFVFVDDDVQVRPGWLDAILRGAGEHPQVGVFAGPIHARFEDHPLRSCGREGPPITSLELGPVDREADHAWGANMTVRRSAIERAGPFDSARELYGDEQEWEQRHFAQGGRLIYLADAALDHRRAGDDARLRSLARAAYRRGEASRRFDGVRAPSRARETLTLAGCLAHALRFRCPNGLVLAAHSAGRLRASFSYGPPHGGSRTPHAQSGEDFLSGESGTVGGRRGALRRAADAALDAGLRASGRMARLDRAARSEPPRRRVLVAAVVRPERAEVWERARGELERSRHEVEVVTSGAGALGKFQNLNELLAAHPVAAYDWLLVIDDDVELPGRFLDRFLFLAERFELVLAQPAHRLDSHAAWRVTRRRALSAVRETAFVEIGPVTAFRGEALKRLLPFPDLRMGWGLDVHWSAVAKAAGWRVGVVDLVAVGHRLSPAGSAYDRTAAVEEARAFLRDREYVPRAEAGRTLVTHRTWRRP